MYILKTPKGCQTLLILIAYPIAACFVYLMVEPWDVHAVMTFGQAFAFALVVWFIDKYPEDRTKVEGALCKAGYCPIRSTCDSKYSLQQYPLPKSRRDADTNDQLLHNFDHAN